MGVAHRLRVRPEGTGEAVGTLLTHNRDLEKRLEAYEAQARAGAAGALAGEAEEVGGARLVVAARAGLAPDELRALAIQVRDRLGRGLVVLGAERDGKASLVAAMGRDLVASGLSAAILLGPAARILGGGSSRDPELAQAGGPHGDRLSEALEAARLAGREALRQA
jgi:alanyl-tRNA synthetase